MGSAVAVKEEEPEDLSLRTRHAATQTEPAGHSGLLEAFTPEQVLRHLQDFGLLASVYPGGVAKVVP